MIFTGAKYRTYHDQLKLYKLIKRRQWARSFFEKYKSSSDFQASYHGPWPQEDYR